MKNRYYSIVQRTANDTEAKYINTVRNMNGRRSCAGNIMPDSMMIRGKRAADE